MKKPVRSFKYSILNKAEILVKFDLLKWIVGLLTYLLYWMKSLGHENNCMIRWNCRLKIKIGAIQEACLEIINAIIKQGVRMWSVIVMVKVTAFTSKVELELTEQAVRLFSRSLCERELFSRKVLRNTKLLIFHLQHVHLVFGKPRN